MSHHPKSPIGQFLTYLDSVTCRCGGSKYHGKALCSTCYQAIPEELAKNLSFYYFARDDEKRMYAFEECKEWLEERGC